MGHHITDLIRPQRLQGEPQFQAARGVGQFNAPFPIVDFSVLCSGIPEIFRVRTVKGCQVFPVTKQDRTAGVRLEQPFVGIPYQAVRPCDILQQLADGGK